MEFTITTPIYNGYPEDDVDFIFSDDCIEIKINDAYGHKVKIPADDFSVITSRYLNELDRSIRKGASNE